MPLAFPPDCLDLVHGRDAFAFDGWEKAWSSAQLFRVTGLTQALMPLGMTRQQIQAVEIVKTRMAPRVRPEWVGAFDPAKGAVGAWGTLGNPQINKHIRQGLPQVFDRALLSLVYVVTFLEDFCHVTVPDDFLSKVSIVPINFHIESDAEDLWKELVGKPLHNKLREAVAPCPTSFLVDVLKEGKRLTYHNAELIVEQLSKAGHSARIACSRLRYPEASVNEVVAITRLLPPRAEIYLPEVV